MTERKTAVLYARYSSDKQREASIDDQLRVCRNFCEAEGIKILKQYTDHALSGKTDQRPEFRQMIANAPESDYVVVYMFDRFSRSRSDSAVYKKMLRECGVRVISAMEPIQDTPEGNLQEGMLEVLSEYYVRDLARKVRRGMEGNALAAKDNGYKIFGYATDPETRRYIICPEEAEVVRGIFGSYIGGETIYSIANRLARDGWTTSLGTPVDYNWVWRVLNRKQYTGIYSWAGIEVDGGMPVIIDGATFAKAAATPKRKPRENETWATYRLSGKLYCGFCGEPMHGYGGTGKKGKRYYYYGCKDKGDCKRHGVRRELVEGAIVEAVLDITSDEERMRMVARRLVAEFEAFDESKADLAACEERIAKLEKGKRNLMRAVESGLSSDDVAERIGEINDELRELHGRRGVLLGAQAGITEDDIVAFLAHGFNRHDEDFIFGSMVSKAFLYEDSVLAVLSFRDEVGDLEEVNVSLMEHLARMMAENGFTQDFACSPISKKDPSSQRELGSILSGVGGGT